MRIHKVEPEGVCNQKVVEIVIEDDNLELPDDIGKLHVKLVHMKDASGNLIRDRHGELMMYREGSSLVCFVNNDAAVQANKGQEAKFSANLIFLITLVCIKGGTPKIIVR